jgi:NAD-dependent oxidoreductase involved in siderophore biosynthesis
LLGLELAVADRELYLDVLAARAEETADFWRKAEEQLVNSIMNLQHSLWRDIVQFLNKHWNHAIAINLDPILVDEDKIELMAVFWMESVEKECIWCEFNRNLGDPIGLTIYIRNPEKENK